MIRFSLSCDAGHGFDAWFRSNEDFETQARRGFVACPQCGTSRVSKALMAPAVATARAREARREAAAAAPGPAGGVALSGPAGAPAELVERLRALKAELLANAVDVGAAFPEEARKIHYGETEARGIYGAATGEEVRDLLEEGIAVVPLPVLPDERN